MARRCADIRNQVRRCVVVRNRARWCTVVRGRLGGADSAWVSGLARSDIGAAVSYAWTWRFIAGPLLVLGLGSGFCFGPGLGEALGFGEGLAVPPPDAEELPPEPQDFFPAHTPFVTYSTPSSPRVRMLTSLAFISSLNGLIFSLSSCSHSLTLMVQYDVLWTVS